MKSHAVSWTSAESKEVQFHVLCMYRVQSAGSCLAQKVVSKELGILHQSPGEVCGCLGENSAAPVHFHCILGTNNQKQHGNQQMLPGLPCQPHRLSC